MTRDEYVDLYQNLATAIGNLTLPVETLWVISVAIGDVLKGQNPRFDQVKFDMWVLEVWDSR